VCWRHSARQRITLRQSAGTNTSTPAFQEKRTRAAFAILPVVAAGFTDGRLRRGGLPAAEVDGLAEFDPTRFAQ
jgi:hypothetical protein